MQKPSDQSYTYVTRGLNDKTVRLDDIKRVLKLYFRAASESLLCLPGMIGIFASYSLSQFTSPVTWLWIVISTTVFTVPYAVRLTRLYRLRNAKNPDGREFLNDFAQIAIVGLLLVAFYQWRGLLRGEVSSILLVLWLLRQLQLSLHIDRRRRTGS